MKKVVTFSWNKKGISIMIGYILLITSAVIMSAVVYQWLKSYVPKDSVDCPDGVSIFVVDSICAEQPDGTYQLVLQLRNNGRFDFQGYFIHATDNEDQELATIDLSPNITGGGETFKNAVSFYTPGSDDRNPFNAGEQIPSVFSVTSKLYSVELIPIRSQSYENKIQTVSCGRAKITEKLICGIVPGEECTADDLSNCETGEICVSGSCTLCGNGIFEPSAGEQCDDGNNLNEDGCDSECNQESGWNCDGQPGQISVCS